MPIDLNNIDLTPEWGKTSPKSTLPQKKDKPKQAPSAPKGDGIVRIERETKGRKGAGVTVITGIPLHPEGLEKLARQFKQQCGTGGTIKNGTIEIQDDHRIMLISQNGQMICIGASDLRVIGRNTQGVRLFNLSEGDKIVSAAILDPEEAPETEIEPVEEGIEELDEAVEETDEAEEMPEEEM